MNNRIKLALLAALVAVFSVPVFAQSSSKRVEARAAATSAPETAAVSGANPTDQLASELSGLRKTLQTLNNRLRDLNPLAVTGESKTETADDRQKRILKSIEILNGAEQRAENLRKQLIDAVEKETSIRSRVIQLEEDMRPENVDRNLNAVGLGTRAPEMRDARRRSLENERDGLRNLLSQIQQSRQRLEQDVQQADQLVVKLRQRVLPLIDREVDILTSN